MSHKQTFGQKRSVRSPAYEDFVSGGRVILQTNPPDTKVAVGRELTRSEPRFALGHNPSIPPNSPPLYHTAGSSIISLI